MTHRSRIRTRNGDHRPSAVLPEAEEETMAEMEAPAEETRPAAVEVAAGQAEPGELVGLLVTNTRVKDLWAEMEAVQDRIHQEIDNIDLAEGLFDMLEKARRLLSESRGNYEEAYRLMASVEYRMLLSQRVKAYSRSHGTPLLAYEVVWALALGLANVVITPRMPEDQGIFVNAMIWGGLGGVVGALHALWRHVARDQDFDKQFAFWYIISPILGVILGSFIFLVVWTGFLTLNSGETAGIGSGTLVYVVAWLAGFQQNVAYTLARRILRVIVGEAEEERQADRPTEGK